MRSGDWGKAEPPARPASNRYGNAAGHCCIAVTGPVTKVITIETGSGDRVANMRVFGERTLALLVEALRAAV